jgi:hypothetical protein
MDHNVNLLIDALTSIGKPVCLDAARKLSSNTSKASTYDLHLRSAGLTVRDATILAAAIRQTPNLRSFSASYNPDITDTGIATLAAAFPDTMHELGMVRCSMRDKGALAILEWAHRAAGPRMVCIEDNMLSTGTKSTLMALRERHKSITLVV